MIDANHDFWLPAPPGEVFDYLADPKNDARWQASCQAAELLDAPCAAGSRYRITFALLGREMRFLCEVTDRQLPNRYAFRAVEGSFHYSGAYDFDAESDGTRVTWRFQAEPAGFFGLIPASLLRKVLLSQVQQDTERLRQQWAHRSPA